MISKLKNAWQRTVRIKTKTIATAEDAISWLAAETALDAATVKKGLLGNTKSNALIANPDNNIKDLLVSGSDIVELESKINLTEKTSWAVILPFVFSLQVFYNVDVGWLAVIPPIWLSLMTLDRFVTKQNEAQKAYGPKVSALRGAFIENAQAFDAKHGKDVDIESESGLIGMQVPLEPIHSFGKKSALTNRQFRPSSLKIT